MKEKKRGGDGERERNRIWRGKGLEESGIKGRIGDYKGEWGREKENKERKREG